MGEVRGGGVSCFVVPPRGREDYYENMFPPSLSSLPPEEGKESSSPLMGED